MEPPLIFEERELATLHRLLIKNKDSIVKHVVEKYSKVLVAVRLNEVLEQIETEKAKLEAQNNGLLLPTKSPRSDTITEEMITLSL